MPWNSSFPIGTLSVKANKAIGQQNTSYIEATMGNAANNTKDHFWNVSADTDGYHRTINMPMQGGDPLPATVSMGGILYLKETSGTAQLFFNNTANAANRYQLSPNFIIGSVVVNATYGNFQAVPANVYGEIFAWTTSSVVNPSVSTGYFRSDAGIVEAWANIGANQGTLINPPIKYANGSSAAGLNILAETLNATAGQIWNYRITYRAI